MDSEFTTPSDDNPASFELDFLSASRLAASGRFDEAKALLCPNGVLPSTPQALDLLARIAVQTGDFKQARTIWRTSLQKNPSFEPAKTALATLASPWFAFAVTKRIALVAVATVMGCLAFVGLLALFQVVPSSTQGGLLISASRQPTLTKQATTSAAPKPRDQTPSLAADASKEDFARIRELQEQQAHQISEQIQVLQSNQTKMLASQKRTESLIADLQASIQAQSTQQKESQHLIEQTLSDIHDLTDAYAKAQQKAAISITAAHSFQPLELAIDGISVHPHETESSIYFNEGLFDRDDHFKIGSRALLETVARGLVRTQEKIRIEVVGYAGNEPPTWPWQKPKSDALLGQLRAERVKKFLENLAIFPSGAISATNGPATERPYPSETMRNRTAVLRICEP